MLVGLAVLMLMIGAWFVLFTPNAHPQSCERTRLAVVVNLKDVEHRQTIAHVFNSLLSGQPRILHIDRADSEAHRAASLRGVPTKPGFDRDEYPPAMSAEGGAGADVAYVPRHDNRSAGAKMGNDLSGYCEGQAFILEP